MNKKLLLLLFLGIFLIGIASAVDLTTNISTYYNFSTGFTLTDIAQGHTNLTVVGSPVNNATGCLIGQCWKDFADTNYLKNATNQNQWALLNQNFTFNVWVKFNAVPKGMNIMGVSAGDNTGFELVLENDAVSYISLHTGATRTYDGANTPNINKWYMITAIRNSSGVFLYVNNSLRMSSAFAGSLNNNANFIIGLKNLGAGSLASLDGSVDEIYLGINRSLSESEINQLWNGGLGLTYPFTSPTFPTLNINLTSPLNNTFISTAIITFNASYSFSNMNTTNTTYYLWNSNTSLFNRTLVAITPVSNISSLNVTGFSLASVYKWNVYGCGINTTGTLCSWGNSGNYTFVSSAFSATSQIYNYSVLETTRQTLSLNVSGNPLISSASANLWYNGTSYNSIVTDGTSGIYKAVNLLDIPLQIDGGNKTFFWEWIFTLINGNIVRQNSTIYSQEVNATYLIACNSTYTIPFINFTTKSAMNPFPKVNATFKSSWNSWLGNGDTKRNYTFESISENYSNWTMCASPGSETFKVNANIEYDANGYAQNFYYLSNASLTNTTNAISLYLLNDSLATVTELITWDNAQNPIPNVLIQIQLYDVGTDTFYTVGMGKTSSEGKDIAYLNWYSTLYKFIFIRNGQVVKTTDPYKISSTPQTFSLSDAITYSFDKFQNFEYNLYYNNATQNFVLTFTKPSGLVDQGCLRVIKRTSAEDTEICLTCETSSSATLYCNIASAGNGTFIGTFYATGSWYLLDWVETTIGGTFAESIYNLLGNDDATAYAFLFSGVVVSMFFLSPVLAIVGLILGILGGAALGFTILNYTTFIGIVILGGIIIWFVRR